MTFASVTQFYVYLPWGQHQFSIVSVCLKCESTSRRFQSGEGARRGLLRDCTTSPINRFAALHITLGHSPGLHNTAAGAGAGAVLCLVCGNYNDLTPSGVTAHSFSVTLLH